MKLGSNGLPVLGMTALYFHLFFYSGYPGGGGKAKTMSTGTPRPRGARRSPAHKAFAAPAHKAQAVPDSFGVVPPQLSYWDNSTYGDCVSAEEAAAKAQFSLMNGGTTELFILQSEVVNWASYNGFLNGADLTSVMEAMAKSGMTVGGQTYRDGPYESVDWTNDATLSSAIYQGPVKIGVAADQLENVVSATNGWIATGFTSDQNTDHCVNLCGFGSLQALCGLLSVAVPPGTDPATRCYLLFTWSTIGIIDRASMLAITSEAWLRTPTTVLPSPTLSNLQAPLTPLGPCNPETIGHLRMILSGILGLLK